MPRSPFSSASDEAALTTPLPFFFVNVFFSFSLLSFFLSLQKVHFVFLVNELRQFNSIQGADSSAAATAGLEGQGDGEEEEEAGVSSAPPLSTSPPPPPRALAAAATA